MKREGLERLRSRFEMKSKSSNKDLAGRAKRLLYSIERKLERGDVMATEEKASKPKSDKRSAQDFIKKGRTARVTTVPVSGKPKSGNPFINR